MPGCDMDKTIPMCEPVFAGNEAAYLDEALRSGFVSSVGPFVGRFESAFARAVGASHAVACASGTAAIHLALRALGVRAGDVVVCSDFTFIATANPVTYQGADPMFVDSEARSWNMAPALLAEAVDDLAREGRRPAAVIVAHVLGQPADLGPILDVCTRQGIPLIEDAAEALGATFTSDYPHRACRGRQVGTIGTVGCFSFNGNKVITSGGGGMVTTEDGALAKRIKHLSTQAKLPGVAYVHDDVGYNYRLTNLAAALGVAQLEQLPGFLERKRAIAARYRTACEELGLTYHPVLPGTEPSCWLASVLVGTERDAVAAALAEEGIMTRPLWRPVSRQRPYAGSRRWGGAFADRLAADGLSLPCSASLNAAGQERVIAALDGALKRVAAA